MYSRSAYRAVTSKDMDTRQLRDFGQQVLNDQAVDSKTKGRVVRCEAILANGFENLVFFVAGVTAGNAAALSPNIMNGLSVAWLESRIVCNWVYATNYT